VWKSNPPPSPRRTASPALKAGKVTGPRSPPRLILGNLIRASKLLPTTGVSSGVSWFWLFDPGHCFVQVADRQVSVSASHRESFVPETVEGSMKKNLFLLLRLFIRPVLVCCIACMWFCSVGFADQISSGFITLRTSAPMMNFSLTSGDSGGFTVTGGGFGGWGAPICNPCSADSSLSVFGFVTTGDFGGGSANIAGIVWPSLIWDDQQLFDVFSNFQVTGPNIQLHGPGTYFGTFSFTGRLCGVVSFSDTSCDVRLPDLTGGGQVEVTLQSRPGFPNQIEYTQATYTFALEPSSYLLVGGVFVLVAGLKFRKLAQGH
jgi:hypothetical protein